MGRTYRVGDRGAGEWAECAARAAVFPVLSLLSVRGPDGGAGQGAVRDGATWYGSRLGRVTDSASLRPLGAVLTTARSVLPGPERRSVTTWPSVRAATRRRPRPDSDSASGEVGEVTAGRRSAWVSEISRRGVRGGERGESGVRGVGMGPASRLCRAQHQERRLHGSAPHMRRWTPVRVGVVPTRR